MKVVEFVRDNAPYRKGESAGFPAERADRFVAAGAAKAVPVRTEAEPARPALQVETKVVRNGSRKG